MTEHPSLTIPKKIDDDAVIPIAQEFLAPFQKIAESRRELKESEDELRGLVSQVMAKLDNLGELKRENLQLERETLVKIRAMIP